MPIYAYRCDACGHAQDVLQKMSDPLLTVCPVCGAAAYKKQLTAAGFQLKGSGWYATDFRNGTATPAAAPASPAGATDAPSSAGGDAAAPTQAPAASPAPSAGGSGNANVKAAAAGGCGSGCGCH